MVITVNAMKQKQSSEQCRYMHSTVKDWCMCSTVGKTVQQLYVYTKDLVREMFMLHPKHHGITFNVCQICQIQSSLCVVLTETEVFCKQHMGDNTKLPHQNCTFHVWCRIRLTDKIPEFYDFFYFSNVLYNQSS